MTGAFGGDPAIKAALLARLEAHAANGTLRFGATAWDGTGGTPLGVSTEGGDATDYVALFGYPLALAGLLDPVTTQAGPERGVEVALRWVACVGVGADLSPVPQRLVDHFLVAMGADRLAALQYADLHALYRAEAEVAAPPRNAWTELRKRLEAAAEAAPPRSEMRAARQACATACWPLRTSGSVLPTLIAAWVQDINRKGDPAFDENRRAQAMATLDDIYRQTQPLRDAGEHVDIPALFRARDPELAAGFEGALTRSNARYGDRTRSVPDIVLTYLAAAQ